MLQILLRSSIWSSSTVTRIAAQNISFQYAYNIIALREMNGIHCCFLQCTNYGLAKCPYKRRLSLYQCYTHTFFEKKKKKKAVTSCICGAFINTELHCTTPEKNTHTYIVIIALCGFFKHLIGAICHWMLRRCPGHLGFKVIHPQQGHVLRRQDLAWREGGEEKQSHNIGFQRDSLDSICSCTISSYSNDEHICPEQNHLTTNMCTWA